MKKIIVTGKQDNINKSAYSSAVKEQWAYKCSYYLNQYLYFTDGILDAMTE
ncbi:MAG: hypothetical protein LBF59_00935 [Prevotellaceae bacterium]|jgi:hypothetical protein|nr:hypothetical protein [Prevotellaceae bacterium]